MPRGDVNQVKVHFKGKEDDFIIFVDDAKIANSWKTDKTIPLAQVVSSYQIFVTGKQGAQGDLNAASHSTLDNEFGTHVDEEVIKAIIEKGTIQESSSGERQGIKNESMGPRGGH